MPPEWLASATESCNDSPGQVVRSAANQMSDRPPPDVTREPLFAAGQGSVPISGGLAGGTDGFVRPSPLQRAAGNAILAAAWVVLAVITAQPGAPRVAASLIYLAPGLGVGCVLAFGSWLWPGILLGTLATNLWRDTSLPLAAVASLAAPLQALFVARLMPAGLPFSHLSSPARSSRFFVVVTLLAPLVVVVGAGAVRAVFPTALPWGATAEPFGNVSLMVVGAWLGIGLGSGLVAPAVLVLADREERARLWQTPLRTTVLGGVMPLLAGIAVLLSDSASTALVLVAMLPALVLLLVALQLPAAAFPLACAIFITGRLVTIAQSNFQGSELPSDLIPLAGFWMAGILCVASFAITSALAVRESLQRVIEKTQRHSIAQLARRAEFFAVLSHELRTPLNSVLLAVDLLLESTLDDEQRDLADTVARAGGSLRTLIDDSLDLSRAESRRLEIHPRPTSVPELLEEVAVVLGESARRGGLTLRLETAPDTPQPFVTDPNLLRRVLLNLVGNAVKYGSPGEVVLRARAEPLAPPATGPDSMGETATTRWGRKNAAAISSLAGLRLEIADDGPGIPTERQADIFEPFARLGEDKRDRAVAPVNGTGLGLAITRELVHHLGGEIGVRDRAQRPGTVFWVVLPALPEDAGARSA